MTILMHWGIYPIGGVASGRICPYSMPSRLVFFFILRKIFMWQFFQSWEQTSVGQNNRVFQKNSAYHLSFLAKVYTIKIYKQEPKKLVDLSQIFFFFIFFPDFALLAPSNFFKINFHIFVVFLCDQKRPKSS